MHELGGATRARTGWRGTEYGLALGALAVLGCDGSVGPTALVVEPASDTLVVREVRQLTAVVMDAGGRVVQGTEVAWGSSRIGVAAVSSSGLVTAVGPGTAIIVAAIPEAVDSATITVVPSIEGLWSGTGSGVTLALLVEEADRQITGVGAVSDADTTIVVTATGVRTHPAVSIILTAPGLPDMEFAGVLQEDDRIAGTLSRAGVADVSLVLERTFGGERL